jgi:hypothetical protein
MKTPLMPVFCGLVCCLMTQSIAQEAAPKAIPVGEVKKSEDPKKIERLQVYLDREGFPPGRSMGKSSPARRSRDSWRHQVAANAAMDLP